MRGRVRLIDERELATLIRKANRVDWYEHFISQPILEEAKKHKIKGNKTYHQFASQKDETLVSNYPLQDNQWLTFKEKTPEDGIEVLVKLKSPTGTELIYPATYFAATDGDKPLLVLPSWNEESGYESYYIRNFTGVSWKNMND